ncbi:unnamed protein product [Symbiodinium pilosum]|uniref:Uncharacterized protein n=1 Tax=Symbiodinium pilosum TaxID=2952 RepID=A0A812JC84_SYMPI|nr:unnamed protein product [Symbiodinium pilosum]
MLDFPVFEHQEEDGEIDFQPGYERIEAQARKLQAAARDQRTNEAIAASDAVVKDLSDLFTSVNKEAGKAVFLLPTDAGYDSRSEAYRKRMAEGKQKNLMRKDGEQL